MDLQNGIPKYRKKRSNHKHQYEKVILEIRKQFPNIDIYVSDKNGEYVKVNI